MNTSQDFFISCERIVYIPTAAHKPWSNTAWLMLTIASQIFLLGSASRLKIAQGLYISHVFQSSDNDCA